MKTPKLIEFTALSLALGMAISLPMAAMSQDEKAKPKAAVKAKVPAKPKKKAKEKPAGKAKPRPRTETPKRSPRLVIPDAPRTTARTDRKPTPKQTWIGVAMAPVPEALREHLELAEGFGIQVQSVVKDSPAQKADLHRNDILTQLDDQILTTPEHLSILVRSKKSGDKVALGLIRKGKPQTIDVVLGESDLIQPRPRAGSVHSFNHHQFQPGARHPIPHHAREIQESIKRQQEHHRRLMETHLKHQQSGAPSRNPEGDKKQACPKCAIEGSGSKEERCPDCKQPQQVCEKKENCPICKKKLEGQNKAGKPPAISVRPGFPLKIFGTTGIVKIDNQEGQLTLTQENDAYAIILKDKAGKEIFSGPYDTAKGVAGLPAKAQSQLKKMKLEDLNVILPKSKAKSERSSRKTRNKDDEIL